jgi:hypothetical protein
MRIHPLSAEEAHESGPELPGERDLLYPIVQHSTHFFGPGWRRIGGGGRSSFDGIWRGPRGEQVIVEARPLLERLRVEDPVQRGSLERRLRTGLGELPLRPGLVVVSAELTPAGESALEALAARWEAQLSSVELWVLRPGPEVVGFWRRGLLPR